MELRILKLMKDRSETAMKSPNRAFMSPTPRPVFYEAPLSTKREREAIPARIGSVPRIARTAPARSRYVNHRFEMQRPHRVSFKEPSTTLLCSPSYNAKIGGSYFDQVFEVIKVLGEGSFGEVVSVRSKDDNRMYAVKRVLDPFRSESDRKTKLREVQKHEFIPPHINLIHFFQAWEEQGRLYIQTELCEQSLAEYTQHFHPVVESEVWSFFVDILQAVDHLHSHGLLHLDIKPENILLTKDKICKLGDFGRVFDLNNDAKDNAEEGDSKYLAMEVLNNLPTKAADIFSLGMTVLEIATDMELPTQGNRWHDIRDGRIPARFFENISTELHDVIMRMIRADPQGRPTTKQLLNMPTISKVLAKRQMNNRVNEMKGQFAENLLSLYIFFLAILAMLRDMLSKLFIWKRTPVVAPRTPVTARTIPRSEHLDWSFSDEENHQKSYKSFHSLQSSDHSMSMNFPENPHPRYRLNFDDDTTSNDSNESPEETATISTASENVVEERSVTPDIPVAKREMGSGDWRAAKFSDDSDSDEPFYRGVKTCPPAMRSQLRTRVWKRPPPRLNLHLLDSPETATVPPPRETTPPIGITMNNDIRRRTRNSLNNKRLISDVISSADEA